MCVFSSEFIGFALRVVVQAIHYGGGNLPFSVIDTIHVSITSTFSGKKPLREAGERLSDRRLPLSQSAVREELTPLSLLS